MKIEIDNKYITPSDRVTLIAEILLKGAQRIIIARSIDNKSGMVDSPGRSAIRPKSTDRHANNGFKSIKKCKYQLKEATK